MRTFRDWFRAKTGSGSPVPIENPRAARTRARRALLVEVVDATLRAHGIPAGWLEPESIAVGRADRERSLQLRLVVRHWDARLLMHSLALQGEVVRSLEQRDPLAHEWLASISWRFDLRRPHRAMLPAGDYWKAVAARRTWAPPSLEELLRSGDESRWAAVQPRADFIATVPMALER